MRAVLFRPIRYAHDTVKKFEENGFSAVNVPMIEILPNDARVRDAHFTILTSQTSARIAVEKELLRGEIIAIGPKTAEIIENTGKKALIPSRYDSRTLYHEFRDVLQGKRVNLLRSDRGDPVLNRLSEVCDLEEYILYSIKILDGEKQKEIVREVLAGKFDAVIFTSSMIVEGFMSNLESRHNLSEVIKRFEDVHVIAIGNPTAKKLEKYGIKAHVPSEYTLDGVINFLKNLRQDVTEI